MKNTPLKIVAIVATVTFVCDLFLMAVLHQTGTAHNYLILIDSVLLVTLLSPVLYLYIYRPITESERKNRSLIDTMNEGVCLHEIIYGDGGQAVDYRILDVNPSFEKITGLPRERAVGSTASELYGTDESPFLERYAEVASTGNPASFETYLPSMGKHFHISVFSPERGKFGTVFSDITLNKELEHTVSSAKKEWEETFDIINDAITIHDQDFNIVRCNRAAVEMLGVRYKTILKQKCYVSYHGTGCPPDGCPSCVTLKTGDPSVTEVFEPHLGKHIEIKALPKFDGGGKIVGLVHIVKDIDQRKRAQKEREDLEVRLRQSQKMEAIGTMAGGIAHDFNNILAVIIGNADLSLDDLEEENPARTNVEQILEAGHRGKDLVSHILSFSRKAEINPVPVKPQQLVSSAMKMLGSTIPRTIEVRQDVDPGCGFIRADLTQMHQVIMNLSTNAVHAMDEKGVLEVGLRERIVGPHDHAISGKLTPGKYIEISIADTGSGMDGNTIERIFDPFFTTKELGKGTGMGLSVVYGIVESHGGAITVDSEPGVGTTFRLLFPTIEAKALPERHASQSLPTGKERILYVEDEKVLADVGSRILERLGYRVEVMTDSAEALDLFRSKPEDFDLVVTDQTMPGLSGTELTADILKIRPGMPIMLCTGFSNKISEEMARELGIRKFCLKPLTREELAGAVRSALDA
jgi:PAS domain S-box-containing protein